MPSDPNAVATGAMIFLAILFGIGIPLYFIAWYIDGGPPSE